MTRRALISELVDAISHVHRPHPIRIAIDGVDAAGKTTLADELVEPLEQLDREVIRASMDGFHNPATLCYQKGDPSPEGYFRDSFNLAALIDSLLAPLGPRGNRQYRRTFFDHRLDATLECSVDKATQRAVLLFDGVFLLRDELRPFWDFSIFVRASFEVAVARAELRDREFACDEAGVRRRYVERYVPGQRLYFAEARPERRADFVVDNDDPERPSIVSHGRALRA